MEVPCRVSAELRQMQSAQDRADKQIPYFGDTEDLQGVVSEAIAPALAQLFVTRDTVLAAKGIEGLNHQRAVEWLLRDLASLERSLYQVWSQA